MAIIQNKGLRGLPGLNRLSDTERQAFLQANADKLSQYRSPGKRKRMAGILFDNQQFINAFGHDAFDRLNNGTQESYAYRNALLTDKIASEAFAEQYSPINADGTRNNKKGLGADYEKYFGQVDPVTGQRVGGISSDGLLKVLESDYLDPEEFESDWKKRSTAAVQNDDRTAAFRPAGSVYMPQSSVQYGEQAKQMAKTRNDRILEHIYNDEADNAATRLGDQVSAAYYNSSIANLTDDEVKAAFKQAITPSKTNLGIPEYASHYGVVEGEGVSSEMKDFSIDEMRDVLAKKAVYDQYLSPEMAMTALNNEAKRYIHDHQGSGKKAAMFAKDVLIASASYTIDKANGFYNLGLMAADAIGDKPVVWVDTQGNVVDASKNQLLKDNQGNVFYFDTNGQKIGVHQEEVARTTLHNMGKNMDGSENTSIFNPQDWTRREQFGVWDKDLAKQYEQLGSSPYKVAYNPDDDRDLLYESFKMMSFGLADAGAQLIPFGIGAAGKALSTASKVGSVVQKLGSGINTASKLLTAESRAGQVLQGTAGALGIAEAYQRGAFQETLAQNMANLEQTITDKGKNDVYNRYNTDAAYKKNVDSLIAARAKALKAEYLASMGQDGSKRVVDEATLDDMIHARAQEQILSEEVQNKIAEYKNSDDYANLQEKAINGAGLAATNTFWPEAIKYGLVNTFGFRKYLYTTPTSVMQKAARNFKGIREITTSAGRRRLTTDLIKDLTRAEKWKRFGKVTWDQFKGGAWTNGTDDMMVDAAERINEDSFSRYLHDYETGESTADTYDLVDGIWSYWKGLQNSLGQETTWEAAAVGGLGSTISGNLHFTNIASLMTKEGREAFKNNFQQRYKRDADGMIERDEQGNPIVEQLSWRDNWRDRLAFFVQNGVLSDYYGKKQELRDLQSHADFVNNILDDMNDFKGIESLISSNIGRENATTIGDEKTMRFVQAFNAVHALENLGKDAKDPTTLSSVVMRHKDLIERASSLDTDPSVMSEEEVTNLLGQYYSNNPGLAQSEENNQIALENIARNARKLQEAYDAYNKAERNIRSLEEEWGAPIVAPIRFKFKMSQALDEHWKERLQTMKEEVGDASVAEPAFGEALIAAVGGKRKADTILKYYGLQDVALLEGVNQAISEQQKKLDIYNEVQKELREAEESGDSNAIYRAQLRVKEAKDNYDEAVEDRMYREDMLAASREKRDRLQEAVAAWEKGTKSKVLKADEIMALDPVTRAMMLRELGERESDPYSPAQRKQIEKLKAQLKSTDKTGDPLQKIQDIALLTQRIAQNEDAYHRISRNPDAAAVQFEKQQKRAAEKAYNLINKWNAETLANYIYEMDEAIKGNKEFSKKQRENYVYRTLRNKSLTLLNLIAENGLLPQQYDAQVQKAIDWAGVTTDIDAVISNAEEDQVWKDNISRNIEEIVQRADSREDIIAALEQVIDDAQNPQVAQDFEKVLHGLEQMGYQRDATVIENRKQRKEREAVEAERKKQEEEAAKAAIAEAQAKAQAAAQAQQSYEVKPDGSNLQNPWDVAPIDQSGETAVQQGELSEPIDLTGENSSLGWQVNSDVKITREIANKEFGENYTDAATDENVDGYEQPKLKATADYLNGKINDRDYLVALGMATGERSWLDSPQTSKEDIAKEAQKKAEARKKYLKSNKKESSSVINNMENSIIDNGDSVQGQSASIADQAAEGTEGSEGKEVHISDETTDVAASNGIGEHIIETSVTTLSGNAMSEYLPIPLADEGRLEHKKGSSPTDNMTKYFAWMNAAGIHLQDIIDRELPEILRRNPRAKVKFMAIRPQPNATNDGDMKTHLMLVLDYDNSINKHITNIHNEENGGVIESQGKKYLIIGTVGYGKGNVEKKALRDILFSNNPNSPNGLGLVKRNSGDFWRQHPEERFYVPEGLSTEVVPSSLIPGYIVKQLEQDENPGYRSISELLSDDVRNPMGLELQDLAWGIQELTQFMVVGAPLDRIMVPRNTAANSGSVFVLIPASNGKMVPSYLKPLFYAEMRDGQLKDTVLEKLNNLTSLDYATRLQAVQDLARIFYFDKDGDFILIGKETGRRKNQISLVHNGNVFQTFTLDNTFDRMAFMTAIEEMNPRINITKSVLLNPVLLKQYDEAGALQTDIALLHTAGSSYAIYGLDAQGKMLKPEVTDPNASSYSSSSDFRNGNRTQVIWKHQYYGYDMAEGKYYLNGVPVTDAVVVKALDYNRRVIEAGLSVVESNGVWNTYILGSKEHPEAVQINKNTKEVKEMTKDDALALIEKIEKAQLEKDREEAAQAQFKIENVENVDLPIGDDFIVDEQTGELIPKPSEKEKEGEEEVAPVGQQGSPTDTLRKSGAELKGTSGVGVTQTFDTLVKDVIYMDDIFDLIEQKWPDAPAKISELKEFLRNKDIEVDAIGTTESAIKAWLRTIEECR